jgi:hypothetical protein
MNNLEKGELGACSLMLSPTSSNRTHTAIPTSSNKTHAVLPTSSNRPPHARVRSSDSTSATNQLAESPTLQISLTQLQAAAEENSDVLQE